MQERMFHADEISDLLHEGALGNARSAYRAGFELEDRKCNRYYVQLQLLRAAELGYPPAQRCLGILALCHGLQAEKCSFLHPSYNKDYAPALKWLRKAAHNKDKLSILILAKCSQLGIGTAADLTADERELQRIRASLSRACTDSIKELFTHVLPEGESAVFSRQSDFDPLHFFRNTPLFERVG